MEDPIAQVDNLYRNIHRESIKVICPNTQRIVMVSEAFRRHINPNGNNGFILDEDEDGNEPDIEQDDNNVLVPTMTIDCSIQYFTLLMITFYDTQTPISLMQTKTGVARIIRCMEDNKHKQCFSIEANTDIVNKILTCAQTASKRLKTFVIMTVCHMTNLSQYEYSFENIIVDFDVLAVISMYKFNEDTRMYNYESPTILIALCHYLNAMETKEDVIHNMCKKLVNGFVTEHTELIKRCREILGPCSIFDSYINPIIIGTNLVMKDILQVPKTVPIL